MFSQLHQRPIGAPLRAHPADCHTSHLLSGKKTDFSEPDCAPALTHPSPTSHHCCYGNWRGRSSIADENNALWRGGKKGATAPSGADMQEMPVTCFFPSFHLGDSRSFCKVQVNNGRNSDFELIYIKKKHLLVL